MLKELIMATIPNLRFNLQSGKREQLLFKVESCCCLLHFHSTGARPNESMQVCADGGGDWFSRVDHAVSHPHMCMICQASQDTFEGESQCKQVQSYMINNTQTKYLMSSPVSLITWSVAQASSAFKLICIHKCQIGMVVTLIWYYKYIIWLSAITCCN